MDNQIDVEKETLTLCNEVLSSISSQQTFFTKSNFRNISLKTLGRFPTFKKEIFRLITLFPSIQDKKVLVSRLSRTLSSLPCGGALAWAASLCPFLTHRIFKFAVQNMASGVIAGKNADEALPQLLKLRAQNQSFTADLLGEFSMNEDDSLSYVSWYEETLHRLSYLNITHAPIIKNHIGERSPLCLAIKLSALYSQISLLNREKSIEILLRRVGSILCTATKINAQIYFDAEDSLYNPILYDVFEKLFTGNFRDFPYPGIVLQAYRKDSDDILERLKDIARKRGSPISVRLVKGAYWDTEVKRANKYNIAPSVFLNKESTDAQFEKLAMNILNNISLFMPAFAGHNIRSLCFAASYAKSLGIKKTQFEIQTLYGMADNLSTAFSDLGFLVRVYVPIGDIVPGMGYLVRRLIENSSNESFLYALHTGVSKDHLKKPQFKD